MIEGTLLRKLRVNGTDFEPGTDILFTPTKYHEGMLVTVYFPDGSTTNTTRDIIAERIEVRS